MWGEQRFMSVRGRVAEGGSLAKSLRGEKDFADRVCRQLLRYSEYAYLFEAVRLGVTLINLEGISSQLWCVTPQLPRYRRLQENKIFFKR